MSSNATAEAMADDTDSHPTVLLQEYTTARAIPVRTALLVQDASIVRLIRSVMSDPALCFGMCFLWMRCPSLWIVLCAFATMGSTVSGYHYYQCTFAESSFGWVFF
jgi:hypothetical protein